MVACLCQTTATFQSTNGDDGTASDVEFEVLLCIGIDTIVVGGTGIDGASADGEMAGSIDGIVLGIDGDVASADKQLALALNTLTTGVVDRQRASLDIDVARVFILMVGGLTCRGGAIEFALDALVAHP